MLVANPADKMIYYYTEGMAAPMKFSKLQARSASAPRDGQQPPRNCARRLLDDCATEQCEAYDVAFLLTRRG